MAAEKAANMQDVDLDDIEVVILVIAKTPQKISQAASFLTRRGWPTTVLSNLSQAIEFAAEKKPDFVLISINHGNPAIVKFTDLLSGTFGATCVGFAENMDTASGSRLAKSTFSAKIQGQASGPNLHRSLRRLLAEKLNINIDDKGATKDKAEAYDKVSVKGGTGSEDHTIVQKNDSANAKRGPTMIKGEGASTNQSGVEEEEVSSGKYTMKKKNRRTLKDISSNPLETDGDIEMGKSKEIAEQLKRSLFGDAAVDAEKIRQAQAAETGSEYSDAVFEAPESGEYQNSDSGFEEVPTEDHQEKEDLSEPNSITSRRPAGKRLGEMGVAQSPASSVNGTSANSSAAGAGQNGSGLIQTGSATATSGLGPHGTAASAANAASLNQSSDQSAGPSSSHVDTGRPKLPRMSVIAADSASRGEGPANEKKDLGEVGPHSIIQRAVQDALQQICRPSNGKQQAISMIEQVGVFPIDSPSLPGYLVLAWPHEEKRAIEPFFKHAQQIIAETFRKMGVQATLEPGFFVQLPQVEFATWAMETAAFSFATNHGHEEIGVAFFPTDKPIPKPRQIEDKTMFSIGVNEISTAEPVTFKVYLHMKKNKKYFLYLRNGRQLLEEQKTRLEGNQVKEFYMKTIDVENMRQFLASCHLKKKLKKAG